MANHPTQTSYNPRSSWPTYPMTLFTRSVRLFSVFLLSLLVTHSTHPQPPLSQILQQIQTSHMASQKSLASVSAQIQVRTREKRVLDLTIQQLEGIPGVVGGGGGEGDVGMYRSVGKMLVVVLLFFFFPNPLSREIDPSYTDLYHSSLPSLPPSLYLFRFLSQPPSTILSTSHNQQKSLQEDLSSLVKKAKYLEKQVGETEGQWRDLMEGMRRNEA